MKAYYDHGGILIYHADCRELIGSLSGTVVSDPPYNVGYHYQGGGDQRSQVEYSSLLLDAFRLPSVVVAYPEIVFRISHLLSEIPRRSAAWVYPANTERQWRLISWFGCDGFPERLSQPYRNPTDKRVLALMEVGREARGYDWREIPQVKNVSPEKTIHPCQNPLAVMRWILLGTDAEVIIDPFMGSGSTLRAAKDLGRKAIGIEIDEAYCEAAAEMFSQEILFPTDFERINGEERWMFNIRYAKKKLIAIGCIDPKSPRGIWRLRESWAQLWSEMQKIESALSGVSNGDRLKIVIQALSEAFRPELVDIADRLETILRDHDLMIQQNLFKR